VAERAAPMAFIVADHASHLTSAVGRTFSPSGHRFPVSMRTDALIQRLNELGVTRLNTYPSILV